MSGGHFDYVDMKLGDIIDQLVKDEKEYPTLKLQRLTGAVMNILHAYDWFMSGDTNKEEFEMVYKEQMQEIKSLFVKDEKSEVTK